MTQTAISAQNLTYTYPGQDEQSLGITVLEHLNLQIEEGSFVAVLGRNGCGKSTLAKLFNAILIPTDGKMLVYGIDTADEAQLLSVRRTVGMVFQNPDNQIVANVVEEDVAFAPENLGLDPAEIRVRVDCALEDVGMLEYRRHAPHLLSGGQKQRVAIAGVIAMRPACIVLDEATAMLDPSGRRDVLNTVMELNRHEHITVILITHHMDEAALADRVLVVQDGGLLADGSPQQVFSQVELLRNAGLEVPDTTALCYELNRRGMQLPLDALSVDDCAQALYAALTAKA